MGKIFRNIYVRREATCCHSTAHPTARYALLARAVSLPLTASQVSPGLEARQSTRVRYTPLLYDFVFVFLPSGIHFLVHFVWGPKLGLTFV